ncbi:MAG: hypothetical protein NZM16_08175 [Thermoflexus sp.]|uniref:hypothetical protein n=1 Tax=Thermoflexus sp. TaxID=1969742 RepID=UPI0025D82D31|nr:hypothetical protein [Thermoflexus sp.]MCS6964007.1 hypothetical protein [Thermoflexus sp.]MDW8184150.1 hypothetical protein [Anaerolineae bacterium]
MLTRYTPPGISRNRVLGALALALAGLFSLWLQVRLQPIPTRSLSELQAEPLAGYVRVQGTVAEPPRWDPKGPRLLFRLNDGTADLRVLASGSVATALQRQERIPRTADVVTVEGRVRENPDSRILEILSPDGLVVERPEPLFPSLGTLPTIPPGTRVQVTGQIRTVRRPYAGLTLVRIQDETGGVEVAWYETLAGRPELPLGAGLRITGALGLYRDSLQVVLDDPKGWAILPWASPPRPIAQALGLPDGAWVGVEGALLQRAEGRWTLQDETGTIEIRLSRELQAALAATPPVGARLQAWGRLRQIRGERVLFPELSLDLRWEPPAATPTPSPSPTAVLFLSPTPSRPPSTPSPTPRPRPTATSFPLGEVSTQPLGTRLAVEGVVIDLQGFSAGWAVILEQGGHRLRLFIPNRQMGELPGREGLYPGATIRATGVLTLYRGELELLPQRGRDIIVRKGVRPEAPPRSIGSLTPGDQGARVQIRGEVIEAGGFSAGLRLTVRDESGAIPVILWENVAAMVPERLKGKGAKVEIIGQVRIYRGELQLIPTVPWEVRSP